MIFPMFFALTALYPLWRLNERQPDPRDRSVAQPLSHAVELVRFAFYGQVEELPARKEQPSPSASSSWALAAWRYDSGRILRRQRAGIAG